MKSRPETPPAGCDPLAPDAVSCSAVMVPSFFTPALSRMFAGGRLPTARNVSSRLSTIFTGFAVIFASSAERTEYLPACSLEPNPPPM